MLTCDYSLILPDGRCVSSLTEAHRARRNNLRALEAGTHADLSVAQWLLRLFEYDFRCAYCGEPYETMDHVLPLANGGKTTIHNVVPCCDACNQLKGTAVWL